MDVIGFLTPKFLILIFLAWIVIGKDDNLITKLKRVASNTLKRPRVACALLGETTFKSISNYFVRSVQPSRFSRAEGFLAKVKNCRLDSFDRTCDPVDPNKRTPYQLMHHEVLGVIREAHKNLNESELNCVRGEMMKLFLGMVEIVGNICIKGEDSADSKFVVRHLLEALLLRESEERQIKFIESASLEFDRLFHLPNSCQKDNALCLMKLFKDVHASRGALIEIAKNGDGSEASKQCFKRIDLIREQVCACDSIVDMEILSSNYNHKFLEIDTKCKQGFVRNYLDKLSAIMSKNRRERLTMGTVIPEISKIVLGKGHDPRVYYLMLCQNMGLRYEFVTSNDGSTED